MCRAFSPRTKLLDLRNMSLSKTLLVGLRILLVDDDEDGRDMLAFVLQQSGAVVVQAGSAAAALKAFEEDVPDVIISDVSMPEQNGYDLVRQIRTLGVALGGEVLAIALTGHAAAIDSSRAAVAGFDMHVTKPVDITRFVDLVAALVHERGIKPRAREAGVRSEAK